MHIPKWPNYLCLMKSGCIHFCAAIKSCSALPVNSNTWRSTQWRLHRDTDSLSIAFQTEDTDRELSKVFFFFLHSYKHTVELRERVSIINQNRMFCLSAQHWVTRVGPYWLLDLNVKQVQLEWWQRAKKRTLTSIETSGPHFPTNISNEYVDLILKMSIGQDFRITDWQLVIASLHWNMICIQIEVHP